MSLPSKSNAMRGTRLKRLKVCGTMTTTCKRDGGPRKKTRKGTTRHESRCCCAAPRESAFNFGLFQYLPLAFRLCSRAMDLGPHTGFHGREYNVRLTYVI